MAETHTEDPAYVGLCGECKRLVYASTIVPETKDITRLIKSGCSIVRMPLEEVRAMKDYCKCPQRKKRSTKNRG